VRIVQLNRDDHEAIRACFDVREAARPGDDPGRPPDSLEVFRGDLFSVWDGSPVEVWYAQDEDGAVVGRYILVLPDLWNLHRALADVLVHPARRRRGIGTALLRHARERAAADGRTLLGGGVREGSAGEEWMRRLGADIGPADVRRLQDLGKVDDDALARLRATAKQAATGYSLVRWVGVTPERFTGQMAAVQNAMNDAPHPDGVEPHRWDERLIRERFDPWIASSARRRYSVAAIHAATGEMAALTAVSVDPGTPQWGRQWVTTVTRPHRGHRLGLLVKTDMLAYLAEAEPQVERIATWNAASNQHMIGINAELGYEVVGRPYLDVELPVSPACSRWPRSLPRGPPNWR
jgi:GNAT superfamily N-acetyltransferase